MVMYKLIADANGGRKVLMTAEEEDEILQLQARAQAEQAANAYKEKRKAELPSVEEQLEIQYQDKLNGTNKWFEMVDAVNKKYPEPKS